MKKALTFLWESYISTILLANLVLGVLILAVNYMAPQQNIFAIYLVMYPLFPIFFLLIYGYNLAILWQNMALSFQCRRKDYFRAGQVAFLVTALGCTLVVTVMGWLCNSLLDLSTIAAGRTILENGILWARPGAIPGLLVLALCLQPMGAALGSIYEKHKILTTVILCAIMLLGVGAVTLGLFMADGSLTIGRPVLLGVCGFFVVLALVGELVYHRSVQTAVVR